MLVWGPHKNALWQKDSEAISFLKCPFLGAILPVRALIFSLGLDFIQYILTLMEGG